MKAARTTRLLFVAAIAAAWIAADAKAQGTYGHGHHHHHHRRHGYHGFYAPGFGLGFGYGYGPSTVAGSYFRGYADLVRARGENNYYSSMAQVYREQAREQAIVNRTASVEQYFALRRLNDEQRLGAIAKSRMSKEQLVALSKKAAPKRLEDHQWDLMTDGLAWPVALSGSEFEAARVRLDELFRLRRDLSNGLGADELKDVQQLAKEMTETLKGVISAVNPADYGAAKRFLKTIAYEARFHPGSEERLAGR